MGILDSVLGLLPHIKKPERPLSFKDKLKWTALIMGLYFLMFSTPAYGVNLSTLKEPVLQLINIIFAARTGTLITVGIGPIVLSSIVLQLIQGTGILKIDMTDPQQKGRFQGVQKLAAICIAVVESLIFTLTGYVPIASPSYFGVVVAQLAISAVIVIFLDEMMVKYGLTSGINLFIAGGVAYSIIAGTVDILIPSAATALVTGGSAALPNAILAFGPLFFAIIVMLVSIYAYDMKVELPLAFSQFRGIGGRLPIPFLYVSVLPVILATSLIVSLGVWFSFLAGVGGAWAGAAHFIAFYQPSTSSTGATTNQLSGGLLYLVSPNFPLPYAAPYGIGSYSQYFNYFFTSSSRLYMPWGGFALVPEWAHVITYTLMLVVLCIIFGKFWVEMTGQNPKSVSEQLQEVGWQIPGFRRDPRVMEGMLNKYIPTITVLGSIFVALLAAFATLTGAIGSGMGVLLTVGIMYMLYQQLERDKMLQGIPALDNVLS